MNRRDLAHALRAAAQVVGEQQFVVVGSAAMFGSFQDRFVPDGIKVSHEADLLPANDPDQAKATMLDGSLGELSSFHSTFGFYVDGVDTATALLPAGWQRRVVPFAPSDANEVIGWCPHPTDLAASKAVANREKDRRFIEAAITDRLIAARELVSAIERVECSQAAQQQALGFARRFERYGDRTLALSTDTSGIDDRVPLFDPSIFGFALTEDE